MPATSGSTHARNRKSPKYITPRAPNLSWKYCIASPKYATTKTPVAIPIGKAEYTGDGMPAGGTGLPCHAAVAVTSTMAHAITRKTRFSDRSCHGGRWLSPCFCARHRPLTYSAWVGVTIGNSTIGVITSRYSTSRVASRSIPGPRSPPAARTTSSPSQLSLAVWRGRESAPTTFFAGTPGK